MNRINKQVLLALLPAIILGSTGLVRAEEAKEPTVTVTPMLRYVAVDGDENRFRHDWWMEDELSGGLEELSLERMLGKDWKLSLEGHAIVPENDYGVHLSLAKPEFGFVRAGYREFRKYYDNSGGFFRFGGTPTIFTLGRELELDLARFYAEIGLTLPNAPVLVLGYERLEKEGVKSLLEWGAVTGPGGTRGIFPASKQIDESVDIFKVDLTHTIENVDLGNQFRYERYKLDASRYVGLGMSYTNSSPTKFALVDEGMDYDLFGNVFHIASQVNEKMYLSAAYLFQHMDGEPEFAMETILAGGSFSGTDKFWAINEANIDQNSHVLNLNAALGPFFKKSTLVYGGIQAEKTATDSRADLDLTEINFPDEAAIVTTRNDNDSFAERLGVRFTLIPFTTLYAEGKWKQGNIALYEEEFITGVPDLVSETVLRFTDTTINNQDYRIGVNTSPLRQLSVSTYYRHNVRDNEYDNLIDLQLEDDGVEEIAEPQDGYSAYIDHQEFTTDEFSVKLSVRPSTKLGLSFRYQYVQTEIDTTYDDLTAGGQTGDYEAHVYTVGATLTPINRMFVSAMFSYRDTQTLAQDNGSTAVANWEGDVFSAVASVGYALDKKTDLRAVYSFSYADNEQNNAAGGLPLGADYTRHGLTLSLSRELKENIIGRLSYGFYDLDDDLTGGYDNYTAHLVSGSCTLRF